MKIGTPASTRLLVTASLALCILFRYAHAMEPDHMQRFTQPVHEIVTAPENRLSPYEVTVEAEPATSTQRNVPMVHVHSPWSETPIRLEVPEYSWAAVPGDEHSADPFFYGREIGTNNAWTVRYPSAVRPSWERDEDGALALDSELDGGYVQRFRVVPRDRMLEVWFGVTNSTTQPMNNVWAQLCMMGWGQHGLGANEPTSSCFLVDGQLASWDVTGQDLTWVDNYRRDDGAFDNCAFLTALADGFYHEPSDEGGMMRPDFMMLTRAIDLPAIAKRDVDHPDRFLVVYSPFGRNVFYNCLVPCFHADPYMNQIGPGETRWTVSFFIFYEGDGERLLRRLHEVHSGLASESGLLSESAPSM